MKNLISIFAFISIMMSSDIFSQNKIASEPKLDTTLASDYFNKNNKQDENINIIDSIKKDIPLEKFADMIENYDYNTSIKKALQMMKSQFGDELKKMGADIKEEDFKEIEKELNNALDKKTIDSAFMNFKQLFNTLDSTYNAK